MCLTVCVWERESLKSSVYGAAASTASLTIEARMLSMDSATDTKGSDEPWRKRK